MACSTGDCNDKEAACAASAGEPLGTTSANALACNAGNIDLSINSQDPTFLDRLAVVRKTWAGIEDDAAAAIANLGIEFDDPIPDWMPSILITNVKAYRYPATTGDIYIPIAPLPFTTDPTFNVTSWTILQGTGDLDGLTVKPIRQPPQFGNGVQTVFNAPGSVVYTEDRFNVQFSGREQSPIADDGIAKIWNVTGVEEITFTSPVPDGVRVDIKLWQPLTTTAGTEAGEVSFKQNDVKALEVTVEAKLRESAEIKEYGATGVESNDATQAFIDACTFNSTVYLVDGVYSINVGTIPDTAKVRKIILQNATLRLEDGQFDIDVAGQHIEIDATAGGVIHGGLRKTLVSADTAIGSAVIPCADTTEIKIGQNISSSFQASGAIDGSKWTNSIRVAGDEFNTVLSKTANSITVNFTVGAAGTGATNALWQNMVLGNGRFDKPGLRFNGYGKVTITGGEFKESMSGYYISTEGVDIDGGLIVETNNVDFSGQFLDAFRMGGYSSLYVNGGSIIGSYDLSKQLCVLQNREGHRVRFTGVKVARGNNDLDFYTFGNSAGGKIGLAELIDCDMDGTWTLPVAISQVNSITGQVLNSVFPAQDALHCWTCEQLDPTPPATVAFIEGFIARGTKFKNYKRAVAGTSYVNQPTDFLVDNFIMENCIFDNTAPFYISVSAPHSFSMINKSISNALVKRNSDGGNLSPLGLYNEEEGMHYSGTTVFDPNDGTTANVFNGLISFDHLVIKGAGDIRANLPPLQISRLIVDEAFFEDLASYSEYIPTKTTLINGGTLNSAHSFTVDRVATSSVLIRIQPNDTDFHVIRRQVQRATTFSAHISVKFSGYRLFAGTYSIQAEAAGLVGTVAQPIVKQTSAGYETITSPDKLVWTSSAVLSHGFNMADGSVELIIDGNGDLAMRFTDPQPSEISLVVDVKGGKRFD